MFSRCSRTLPRPSTCGPTCWRLRKDEAIAIQSEEVYERYMKFLSGTADGFRIGFVDINQFTLEK